MAKTPRVKRNEPVFGLVQRYVFRMAGLAFLACLAILVLVVWVNQSLRELNLVTTTNQTFIVFFTITALSLPLLIAVIAPVSLFIAVIFTLNKQNGDSELVVMSAAGMSPSVVLRPLLLLSVLVSLLSAVLSLWAIPSALRVVRDMVTKIRADVVSNFLREGQFITLDKRVTFHFREKVGDALAGIFIHDRRESGNAIVYSAERGRTLQSEGKSFLVLEKGVVQRLGSGTQSGGLVTFDRYAVDLSQLAEDAAIVAYRPRERSTYELMFPNKAASDYARDAPRLRAELHERLSFPLYPIVFTLIAFAALGTARTTRQGRGVAIGLAVIAAGTVRLIGYAISTRIVRSPSLIPLIYVVPLLGALGALIVIRFEQIRSRLSASSAHRKEAHSPMPVAS